MEIALLVSAKQSDNGQPQERKHEEEASERKANNRKLVKGFSYKKNLFCSLLDSDGEERRQKLD